MLSSQELGVIAKLDLVEGQGGRVVPVDYKKGAPQPDGSPWPSDEVQVCLQALVLREHGYRCEPGALVPRSGVVCAGRRVGGRARETSLAGCYYIVA
ncbi:MAG: Dna2/Cas4 domain-containing protein, partial [Actinobacteria bacterium]|nr:Dna2/Cas4 domain-containing protein [Actinomycetota bacterium]